MFPVRKEEPAYAFLKPTEAPEFNLYGAPVDLSQLAPELTGRSLRINGDAGLGENPDRYKQHGFHFTADNCIGCHACEAACSEKNNLPAYISFRSVGYVEGGTWPDYKRVNLSMACNHCDDPVCLKGCPTRAYTKFVEYGAVLQDPDICFGCGYCTWVCPYNAPQLDTVAGHVSKCNMCVDRLEVGLKPACVSACLAGALDFGVIETTPENRVQAKAEMPGFPNTAITHPNIRFQQVKSLPREMSRPDAMPITYVRQEDGQGYAPQAAKRPAWAGWGFAKLRSREDPLVIFTLITQGVVGAFLTLFLGSLAGLDAFSAAAHPVAVPAFLFALLGLQAFALVLSTLHLGRPHRFYRAFYNLRHSPVSREVAAIALFFNALAGYGVLSAGPTLFGLLPAGWGEGLKSLAGWAAAGFGPLAIYAMSRIYRIPARPFWDHWQVYTAFFGTVLTLGPLAAGLVFAPLAARAGTAPAEVWQVLAWPVALGLAFQGLGLFAHARDLRARGGEAEASANEQRGRFGYTYWLRNGLLAAAGVGALAFALAPAGGPAGGLLWLALTGAVLVAELLGRALFYVLVVPTTMPGAFFWRNRAFETHARETGLADLPQVGVMPQAH